MNRFRQFTREWLENQNQDTIYRIARERNVDIEKYFTRVRGRYLVNKQTRKELIDGILCSNIDYKDVVQTGIRVAAALIAMLGLIWGVYTYTKKKPDEPPRTRPIPCESRIRLTDRELQRKVMPAEESTFRWLAPR